MCGPSRSGGADAAAGRRGTGWRRARCLASPGTSRANHLIRTLPPSLSAGCGSFWGRLATMRPSGAGHAGLDVAVRCVRELLFEEEAAGPALREAAAAARSLEAAGWEARPAWPALLAAPDLPRDSEITEPSDLPRGWQRHAAFALNLYYREHELLPALAPASRALLRSQSGAQAGAWLAAVPCDPGTPLSPEHMHLALRRRLRLPLPLTQQRCGGDGKPGCGREADVLGDHRVSCPRSGLLARRALAVEQAWVRVAREAVGPEGRSRSPAWLGRLRGHGAGSSDGRLHAGAADRDGVVLSTAERRKCTRYPELGQPGPQRLVVLAAEVGGRWHAAAPACAPGGLHPRCRGSLAPAGVGAGGACWWGMLAVAVQRSVCSTVLGRWMSPPPLLGDVLCLAEPSAPSSLPLCG